MEALRASPVVYADETGWKQGGRRVWLWVFTNLRETVYEILPGRGFEQAASVLGKNYAGTLGVDERQALVEDVTHDMAVPSPAEQLHRQQ